MGYGWIVNVIQCRGIMAYGIFYLLMNVIGRLHQGALINHKRYNYLRYPFRAALAARSMNACMPRRAMNRALAAGSRSSTDISSTG